MAVLRRLLFLLFVMLSSGVGALELQGSLQQGGLVLGIVEQGSVAYYQDKPLQLTDRGQFLLGLGRDAPATIEIRTIDNDQMQTIYKFNVAQREYRIQKVNGVPAKTVTPSESDVARIRNDAVLVRRARRDITSEIDFLGGFDKPLNGPITGVYGSQRVYNGVPKNPHYGVDYAAPTGTVVKAPAAGIVRLAHRDFILFRVAH